MGRKLDFSAGDSCRYASPIFNQLQKTEQKLPRCSNRPLFRGCPLQVSSISFYFFGCFFFHLPNWNRCEALPLFNSHHFHLLFSIAGGSQRERAARCPSPTVRRAVGEWGGKGGSPVVRGHPRRPPQDTGSCCPRAAGHCGGMMS